jgi:uncharacterized membrane protein
MNQAGHIRGRDVGSGHNRNIAVQRWGAVIGGGALAIYGLTRRSPLGVALAAGGGTLAYLGANQKALQREPAAWTTLLVNCTPQQAYRLWKDIEELPRFLRRLESVTTLDARRSRWVALGPLGRRIKWDAELAVDRENQFLEWRSLPGSDVRVDLRVEFREAPANRGTLISAIMEFRTTQIPGSAPLARFLSKNVNFLMRQDLRRLEALMETGEIPTTEGQSHGPRDVMTALLRVADPTRPIRPESRLRDVFEAERRVS